jgi:excisionase family DNA binding protein
MLSVEIRFVMQGKEMSLDSIVEVIAREVRNSVREEIKQPLAQQEVRSPEPPKPVRPETPVQAVSIREAARLLSISTRTVQNYIALKGIRTVRVGRRVLVPMNSVNEVASRGIPRRVNG